jgi:hypothetical protein
MKKRIILILAVVVVIAGGWFLINDAMAKQKAASAKCANNMSSIISAARFWAEDHGEKLPADFLSMTNELVTTEILVCPGDHSRKAAATWAAFTPADSSSYEIVTPGLQSSDTNAIYLRCKVHGHTGFGDATVFDGNQRRAKE